MCAIRAAGVGSRSNNPTPPREDPGEQLCTWVEQRDGETATADDIRAFCQGQIAHYKIPRHIKFTDAFPMTVTGKIQKFLMREQTIRELGLEEQKTA